MKPHEFNQALDHLDKDILEAHLAEKEARTALSTRPPHRRTARRVAVAACALLFCATALTAVLVNRLNEPLQPSTEIGTVHPAHTYPLPDIGGDLFCATEVISELSFLVHYVTPEGGIDSTRVLLPANAYALFAEWRARNGIGEEVVLTRFEPASECGTELRDGGNAVYIPGPEWLELTVTGLGPYLTPDRREALLETLEATMGDMIPGLYERVEIELA